LDKVELASGATTRIESFDDVPLGKLHNTDTFLVPKDGQLDWMTVEQATAKSTQVLPVVFKKPSDGKDMTLVQANSDQSDSYLLLRYENDTDELIQVVKIR
jgi:hypothetical protein